MDRALIALVVAFGSIVPTTADAQTIVPCDAPWLDVLRLRAIVRVEVDVDSADELEVLRLEVASCTDDSAEARVVRNDVLVEARTVELADVAPAHRARLLGLVLAELTRVALLAETDVPDTVADVEPPSVGSEPSGTLPDEALAPPEDVPQRFGEEDVAFEMGVRAFVLAKTHVTTTRVRFARRHLVLDARFSAGPVLARHASNDLEPLAFRVGTLMAGARHVRRRGRRTFELVAGTEFGFAVAHPRSLVPLGTTSRRSAALLGVRTEAAYAVRIGRWRARCSVEVGYARGLDASNAYGIDANLGAVDGLFVGSTLGLGVMSRSTR